MLILQNLNCGPLQNKLHGEFLALTRGKYGPWESWKVQYKWHSLKYKLNNTIYTSKNILNKVEKIIKEL
jgi:hypothetical protein